MAMEEGAPAHVVEVRGLTRQYRGRGAGGQAAVVTAVDGVSLSVRPGELVVLLGPSGCGKTTLLRCVAGLDKPDAGEIAINGRRVFSDRDKLFVPPEERRMGMMFQSYALWPHMTVAQNVAYPLGPRSQAQRFEPQVSAMLERLGVAGLGHRYPGELSGGQQQRVALARALIAQPSVILFDEPLSNVDAKVRRRLRAELRELKARTRFAGIYVTHDQEEAMELADTLVVMEAGRIRQSDSPRNVYAFPSSIYVAEFVGEMNRWPARVATAADGAQVLATALGELPLPAGALGTHAGDTGWLGVRPEHVMLGPQAGEAGAPGAALRFRGLVSDVIHLGARVECRLALQGAEVVAWIDADAAAGIAPERGQHVDVAISPDKLRWLPD